MFIAIISGTIYRPTKAVVVTGKCSSSQDKDGGWRRVSTLMSAQLSLNLNLNLNQCTTALYSHRCFNTVNGCIYTNYTPPPSKFTLGVQFILYITVYIVFYYSQFYIYTYVVYPACCVLCAIITALLQYSFPSLFLLMQVKIIHFTVHCTMHNCACDK